MAGGLKQQSKGKTLRKQHCCTHGSHEQMMTSHDVATPDLHTAIPTESDCAHLHIWPQCIHVSHLAAILCVFMRAAGPDRGEQVHT